MDRIYPQAAELQGTVSPNNLVLLADPMLPELDELNWRLCEQGFDVITADTIGTARQQLHRFRPSFVLCELKFADGDGFEIVRIAKRLNPKCRIIVHTRFANVRVAVYLAKHGATDIIPKPSVTSFLLGTLLGQSDFELANSPSLPRPNDIYREHIRYTLDSMGGNVSATARILAMHRRSLQRYIDRCLQS
jgi:two-component system response regulator RegA